MAITQVTDYEKCCGCSVCESVCPQSCITMQVNKEGFLYPIINKDKCIDCSLCIKSCPINECPEITTEHKNFKQKVYACRNNSDKILMKSSSGGLFFELAKKVIEEKGSVFGAAFDIEHYVHHIKVTSIKDLNLLLGSKYVQSNKQNIWPEVKQELKNGKKVLFSGTPCEIGALRSYLKKNYDNLLCVDFICMGVPSPLIWHQYISTLENKYNSHALHISFRSKKYGAHTHSLSIDFENGKHYWRAQYADPYVKGFHSRLYLRKSCHNCSYKKAHRESDITLADFWGIQRTNIPIPTTKGVSMIILQSPKGENIYKQIKENFETYESNIETALKLQPMLISSCTASPYRNKFYKDILEDKKRSFLHIMTKYASIHKTDILKSFLKQNSFLRHIVRILKR